MIGTICAFFDIGIVLAVLLAGLAFVVTGVIDAARWVAGFIRRPQ